MKKLKYIHIQKNLDVCKELHIFTQELKNGKPKTKNGKEIPPAPKPDEYEPNMQVYSYLLQHVYVHLTEHLLHHYSKHIETRQMPVMRI